MDNPFSSTDSTTTTTTTTTSTTTATTNNTTNRHQQNGEERCSDAKEITIEELQDPDRGDNYLEILREFKLTIADKTNECERLKIQLEESQQEVFRLNQQLNESKLTIFERDEDAKKNNEESVKSKKLEMDCVKLMSELLDMREQNDLYRQNILDNYLKKTNAINNFECFMTSGSLKAELHQSKLDFEEKDIELSLALAKLRNLEEENVAKEKNVNELRKTFEDAKVTHQHEITVLQEYVNCLKNTVSSYEKTLSNYESPIKSQESIKS